MFKGGFLDKTTMKKNNLNENVLSHLYFSIRFNLHYVACIH